MSKKTTKREKGVAIQSLVKFQQDDGIESVTISGKQALGDVEIVKGDLTIFLHADKDKLNHVSSRSDFIETETTAKDDDNDSKATTLTLNYKGLNISLENAETVGVLTKKKTGVSIDFAKLVEALDTQKIRLETLEVKSETQAVDISLLKSIIEELKNKTTELSVVAEGEETFYESLEQMALMFDNLLEYENGVINFNNLKNAFITLERYLKHSFGGVKTQIDTIKNSGGGGQKLLLIQDDSGSRFTPAVDNSNESATTLDMTELLRLVGELEAKNLTKLKGYANCGHIHLDGGGDYNGFLISNSDFNFYREGVEEPHHLELTILHRGISFNFTLSNILTNYQSYIDIPLNHPLRVDGLMEFTSVHAYLNENGLNIILGDIPYSNADTTYLETVLFWREV